MASYERRMAKALASVINVLDPDVIVLGGGLSNIARLYEQRPALWSAHVFAAGVADTPRTRLDPCSRTAMPAASGAPPGCGQQIAID